jgi:branched-chain amino acid transport system ATP-binding protein
MRLVLATCKSYRQEVKILAILETFDLQDLRNRQVKHLSLGEKRRLEIAMAVLTEPDVLLLDEPLAGLAESEIKGILDVLRRHVGKRSILIVEHKISHVEDFLQRLTVMHEGKIIADGGCEETLRHPEVRRSYWQIDVELDISEHAGP